MKMSSMMPDVKEVLIPSSEIQDKVRELGERITEDYRGEKPLLIGVLRGAVVVRAGEGPAAVHGLAKRLAGFGLVNLASRCRGRNAAPTCSSMESICPGVQER